jgi:sn-glycerol 3-phosphate transport system permease protein
MAHNLRASRTNNLLRKSLVAYVLVFPTILAAMIFYIYPLLYSLFLSFYDWDLLNPMSFLALENYRELFTSGYFFETLSNSLKYSLGVVILALSVGLILAVMLNRPRKFFGLFQACIFSSYIISWVAIALLWVWLLDPQYGLVNTLLKFLGVSSIDWLGDPKLSLFSLVLVSTWKIIGYPMVIYLAGLHTIPREYYEACEIDGANAWHKFRYITWPLLSPITLFLLITLTISSFQAFDIVKLMTQGGPVHVTTIYVYYIYELAFMYSMRLGFASSAVVVFFIMIFALTVLQFGVLRKRVHYL